MVSRAITATCEMLAHLSRPICVSRLRAGRPDSLLHNNVAKRSIVLQHFRLFSSGFCSGIDRQEVAQTGASGIDPSLGQAHCSQTDESSAAPSISPSQDVGYLHLIVGPMFSGKTTELLRIVKELEATGLKIAVVKSDKDVRYKASAVVSHNGTSQVFAIDEAQFFPDLLEFCRWAADVEHRTVIVAGLDGDFRRKKFGQLLDAIPFADSVMRLSARCTYCSGAAPFTMRIVADEAQELVGGSESYAPVCRRHYNALSSVRGALTSGGQQQQLPQAAAACCN